MFSITLYSRGYFTQTLVADASFSVSCKNGTGANWTTVGSHYEDYWNENNVTKTFSASELDDILNNGILEVGVTLWALAGIYENNSATGYINQIYIVVEYD